MFLMQRLELDNVACHVGVRSVCRVTAGALRRSLRSGPDLVPNSLCARSLNATEKAGRDRRPILADCVEEVGELIVPDGSERQARAGSLVLKRVSEQAAGSALP